MGRDQPPLIGAPRSRVHYETSKAQPSKAALLAFSPEEIGPRRGSTPPRTGAARGAARAPPLRPRRMRYPRDCAPKDPPDGGARPPCTWAVWTRGFAKRHSRDSRLEIVSLPWPETGSPTMRGRCLRRSCRLSARARPSIDNRQALGGIVRTARTRAPWRDAPGRFGKWSTNLPLARRGGVRGPSRSLGSRWREQCQKSDDRQHRHPSAPAQRRSHEERAIRAPPASLTLASALRFMC
jgi:transposase